MDEIYKLKHENIKKQYNILNYEYIKNMKQLDNLQKRINDLSYDCNSEEFKKLPKEIRDLSKENIYDETIHLYNNKNKILNTISKIQYERIKLLLNK